MHDALDRLEEGLALDGEEPLAVDLGQLRIVICAVRVQPGLAGACLDRREPATLGKRDRHLARGQAPDDVEQEAPGSTARPPSATSASSGVRTESSMSVAASMGRSLAIARVEEDAGEDLDARARGDGPADYLEAAQQLVARAGEAESLAAVGSEHARSLSAGDDSE